MTKTLFVEYQKTLKKLEKQLFTLGKEGFGGGAKKIISLKGILKGYTFTEDEIEKSR